MITYAQNFEDVLLARVFRHKPHGFYIDVGAHDPVDLSTTKYFYDLGWHGINIEPVPSNHRRFVDQRPRDINLNMAVGDRSGVRTLHVIRGQTPYVADGTALSTLRDDLASKSAEVMGGHPIEDINVDVRTLAEICTASCREPIDFLKIDVEGWEKQVLQGSDFKKVRPVVIVVEATKPNIPFKGFDQIDAIAGWDDWEPILLGADYRFAHFDGLNRFYVRAEDAASLVPFFSLPIGLYDGVQLTNPLWVSPSLKDRILEEDARYQEAYRKVVDEQNACKDLRAERDAQAATLAETTARLVDESEVRKKTEADLRANKDFVKTLQTEIAELRTRLDADCRRADTAAAHAHALTEQVSSLTILKRGIDERLLAETARVADSVAQNDSLVNRLAALEKTLAATVNDRDASETRLRAESVRVADSAAQHGALAKRFAALEKTLAATVNERDASETRLRAESVRVAGSAAQHGALVKRFAALEKTLAATVNERDASEKRLRAETSRVADSVTQNDALAKRLATLEKTLATTENDRDAMETRFRAETSRVAGSVSQNDLLVKRFAALEKTLATNENDRDAMETRLRAESIRVVDSAAQNYALAKRFAALEKTLAVAENKRAVIEMSLRAETARVAETLNDREACIVEIARLTAVAETLEQTRTRLYQENKTLSERINAVGVRLLTLERQLADANSEKASLETARQNLLAQAEATLRTLQDKDKAILAAQSDSARVIAESQTRATRLAAANQRLSLIRTMARENAFRRRHRLRLALLRWFPPLARFRHAIPDAEFNNVIIADLLRPQRAVAVAPQIPSVGEQPSLSQSEPSTSPPVPKRVPVISSRLKITVITPSFNTGDDIEKAILSVQEQDYVNVEHWIIDGGSTDNTLDILKSYPHLKWISEPDKGQSDAMNKGFARATGDIIVYLNADDVFLPGAFSAVIPSFEAGANVVMGRVRVIQEKDGLVWENDSRTDLAGMLRHWERDAFCVNPVGYFYRKMVQEQIPFNLANDDKMDLEFLLDIAARFEIVKVDATLGVFNYAAKCKTGKQQSQLDYWHSASFPFINRLAKTLPPDEARSFSQARTIGYQQRRAWTLQELAARTSPEEVRRHPGVLTLPPLGGESEMLLTEKDLVIFTLADERAPADGWPSFFEAFPPNFPIRHLRSDADIVTARQFLDRSGTRFQPYVVVLADISDSDRGSSSAFCLFSRLFGQQMPPKALKAGRTLNTFTFRRAAVAVIAPDKATILLPKLAARWSGAESDIP